ncbi:MAG: hypothetical protein KatS3mg043_1778 [Rhodothermaceae bacterium]|nr:MAG: hypothetical protein KatS3mg043_1778 [Rhodothermaceae bacterium]
MSWWELLVDFFLVWPGDDLDSHDKRRVALGCVLVLVLLALIVGGVVYVLA